MSKKVKSVNEEGAGTVNIYKMSDAELLEGLPPEVQERIMLKVEAEYIAFEAQYEAMKEGLEGKDLFVLQREIKVELPKFRKEAIERAKLAYLHNEKPPTEQEIWEWKHKDRSRFYDTYISPKGEEKKPCYL